MTPNDFRARGLVYPRALRPEVIARAVPQIERFLPAGDDPLVPFDDDEQVPVGFRFPSPRGLAHVAAHGDFELTLPGIDAAFFGDLQTTFDYPWVEEFGAVALLDPLPLSPYRVRARPGWLICDGAQIVPKAHAAIVPTRAMAGKARVGMHRGELRDAIGAPEYDAAVESAVARSREYVEALPLIDARVRELQARHAAHPDEVRAHLKERGLSLDDLSVPTFNLSKQQRDALLRW